MISSRLVTGTLVSIAGTLAVTVAGSPVPALADQHSTVSAVPASGTPQLAPNGTVEQVRQIVQCGSRMYAVGSFTRVHGRRATNIVKVNTTTGAVRRRFARHAGRTVETIVVHGRHVLTGGFFKSINGSGRNYYASLNSRTGRDDRYLRLSISGHYNYPGVIGNRTRIYNQQLSPSGRRLLVEGDFRRVHGTHREQIFMLSLRLHRARVTRWRSTEFYRHCSVSEPFYLQAASWSPDNS